MKIRFDHNGEKLLRGEYERKDGRYEYKYTDLYGKRLSVYADTLQQLRVREYEVTMLAGVSIVCDMRGITLNDEFEMWFATKSSLRENTKLCYRTTYDCYVRNGIGKRFLNEITTTDLKIFYNSLMVNNRLSVTTITHIQNIIFQVFQMAKENGGIINNPAERAIRGLKRTHSKHSSTRNGMMKSQATLFLNYIKNHEKWSRWYTIFCVMINTGLRLGEITGLRWSDVDLQKQSIHVNHALIYYNNGGQGSKYHICNVKTEASLRVIPFDLMTKEAFLLEHEYQKNNNIKCLVEIDGYTDFIFLNRFGGVYGQSVLNRALKRIICEYNENQMQGEKDDVLPCITCHQLRHTYANILCENKVNPKVIQRLMGHTGIETTMDIYINLSEEVVFGEYCNKIVKKSFKDAFGMSDINAQIPMMGDYHDRKVQAVIDEHTGGKKQERKRK